MFERNPWPHFTKHVFIPGLQENLRIQTKIAATGALNRATYVTEICLMKSPLGCGFKGTCADSEFIVRTHAMLDFQEKPDAWANHVKKVAAQLRKLNASAVVDTVDLALSLERILRITGDEATYNECPGRFNQGA